MTRDLIGKLAVGDAVVHIDHGIARYAGMTQREYGGATKEYLQLDFAGDDKIFLPADQIGRITRYSGGPAPTLSRLGGTDWERTKGRVRRAVAELARGPAGDLRRAGVGTGVQLLAGHDLAA